MPVSPLLALLDRLELALEATQLWSKQLPEAEAFTSQQPFCVDTMSFTQWLQFVFLPRMRALAVSGQPLPTSCGILPMAEQTFSYQEATHQLVLDLVGEIDQGIEAGAFL